MYLSAGRTLKSQYDRRVPVHIAVQAHDDAPILSLCGSKEIAPTRSTQVSITCTHCLSLVDTIPEMCRIPASDSLREDAIA